ncbi:ParB N-terminal domain-containing protein [Ralstonia pseudosolanacearum]|uniref:ParB N-terminal domain-containing protein n=1 Tax=Ralstonia pseudosolanacearum TaxID=1310165 RepID=UPI00048B380D|nr:ParB N-terminal domain-containing protein [Ralstonia pseudosolanacearum]MDO3579214.1 ParB N-terminal domain-containing protein [Ralstonia pseudosolanacearum]MDO3588985.1 ParB N-terminal domain-containing protein [Ralstonia pseudosolanacearum]
MTTKTEGKVWTDGPIGLTHPSLSKPERVPFGSLKVDPERFQVRNPEACSYVQSTIKKQESIELSASLRQLVESGSSLDPLIVWEDPQGNLWVIDGHHRMEAMTEADVPASHDVWVQRFNGSTEAEARQFALEVNKRIHLNMHPQEVLEAYWRMLLSGETAGSVRQRVKRYGVSQSTVQRMDKEKPSVLAQLQQQATATGVPFDDGFIRANAPTWKKLAAWRESPENMDKTDLNRKAVEKVLRALAVRLTDDAKAQPEVVLEAFQEFYEEATGRPIVIRHAAPEGDTSEF